MTDVVLDASAVLALLLDEPGADEVTLRLDGAAMSAANLAEVLTKLVDAGVPLPAASEAIGLLGIRIVPLDADAAFACAQLRPPTRERGLSLGDRACLALAKSLGVPAWTADRAWSDVDGVEVRQIR